MKCARTRKGMLGGRRVQVTYEKSMENPSGVVKWTRSVVWMNPGRFVSVKFQVESERQSFSLFRRGEDEAENRQQIERFVWKTMQTGKDGAADYRETNKRVVSKVEVDRQQWEPVGGIVGSEADPIISPEVAESKKGAGDVILKKLSLGWTKKQLAFQLRGEVLFLFVV